MLDTNLFRKDNFASILFTNIIPIPYTYSQRIAANIANALSSSSNNLESASLPAPKAKLIKAIKAVKAIKVIKKGAPIKRSALATKGKKVISAPTIISLVKSKHCLSLGNKIITSALLVNIFILRYIF